MGTAYICDLQKKKEGTAYICDLQDSKCTLSPLSSPFFFLPFLLPFFSSDCESNGASNISERKCKVSRRMLVFGLLWTLCLCCGTWLLSKKAQGPPSIGNVLEKNNAISLPNRTIDLEKDAKESGRTTVNSAEILKNNELTFTIENILKKRGYVCVPLDRFKGGYLGVEVGIEGRKVYLILDTGSPVTHLDLERTKHLQLKWHRWYGSEDARSFCHVSKLEVGGLEVSGVLVAGHDESETNRILKQNMDREIDGEFGSDILVKLSAVIDYSTFELYLRSSKWKGIK